MDDLDILFIENVGNLICPGDFPIGAQKRVVIISVTEGPYMVVKHPLIFQTAEVVAINKVDLASAMGVDPDALVTDAVKVNPRIKAVKVSVRNGQGLAEFVKALGLEP